MIGWPTPHGAAAIALAIAMFYGFASGRLKTEIISLLTISAIAVGLYAFPLPGRQPGDGLSLAFSGFGHHALIAICALMVLGRGLVTTGALEPAIRILTRVWRWNRQLGLLVTLLLALSMSMLVNDTPVLVLLLPILSGLAVSGGMPASRTLIPVNAAVLIGGMATTIGTSTNLLVVSIASDLGLAPMSVFHFTPIVLMAALIALPFIWLVMPRLLPDNSVKQGSEARRFRARLRLGPDSPARDKSAQALAALLPPDVSLVPGADEFSGQTRRIGVMASHASLEEAARLLGATAAPQWLMDRLKDSYAQTGEDLTVAELSITAESDLVGRTVETSGFAGHNVAVLGVHEAQHLWRSDETAPGQQTILEAGDILLVAGTLSNLHAAARALNLLLLEGAKELPRTAKAPLALAIMAGSIVPASLGLVPIAISALGGAIVMFVTGCVKFERVGRALSAQVVVLVAASIVIGRFILESGAAQWMSQLLALGLQHLSPAAVLACIMLFVTVLTNFASNTTAAAVGTPIAVGLGNQLGIAVEPLVLAVLFGCNLCYATPVAYQTNMLIMSAGNYQFRDYARTGIPLVILMIVTLSALLVSAYGL